MASMRRDLASGLLRLFPFLLVIAPLLGCAGARNPGHLKQLGFNGVGAAFGPGDGPVGKWERRDPGGGGAELDRVWFTLTEARTLHGREVPAGTTVVGLWRGGADRWLVPPEFEDIVLLRTDAALVRIPGEKTWSRYDTATGTTEPLPYSELHRVRVGDLGWRFGVTPQPNKLWTITFLGADARPAHELYDVVPGPWELANIAHSVVPPVTRLPAGGLLVRQVDATNTPYEVMYTDEGVRRTPDLPPLRRLGVQQSPCRLEIPLEGERMFWPVRPDGSIPRKPAEVLGATALGGDGSDLCTPEAWAVAWKTDAGPRFAVVPGASPQDDAFEASREIAVYDAVRSVSVPELLLAPPAAGGQKAAALHGSRPGVLVHVAGEQSWMILSPSTREPLLDQTFAGMDSAIWFLNNKKNEQIALADAARREEAQREKEAAAKRAREIREKEERKKQERKERELKFEALLRAREFDKAIALAKDFPTRAELARAVAAEIRAKGTTKQSCFALEQMLPRAGSGDGGTLSGMMSTKKCGATHAPSTGGGGGRSRAVSSPGYASSAPAAAPTKDHAAEMRWNNMINYLSGQQSWYFSSSGAVRR